MKYLKLNGLPAIFSLLLLMWGCYPEGPEYAEDMDLVFTTYDVDFNFGSKKTYAMPDKIVIGVDIDKSGDTTFNFMDQTFADQILAQIDNNMQAYGWNKTDIANDPDMLLMPAGTSSTTYYYSWWYDWWYYDWYYYWWGWYYPPYVTVSSYTTGSLILVLTDPDEAQNNPLNKSSVSWISVSNGILTYNYNLSRVIDAINQSFDQSNYLRIN
jgi:hypothetical protein